MIEKDKDQRSDATKPLPPELRSDPESKLTPSTQTPVLSQPPPQQGKEPASCRLFMWGKCTKGINCKFSHDYDFEELKSVIQFCHNFQNKGCAGCSYLHATTDEVELFNATGQLPRVLIERHANAAAATAAAGNAGLVPEAKFANRPPPPPHAHGSGPHVPPMHMIRPNVPGPHILRGPVPPVFPRPQVPISGQPPIYQLCHSNVPPPAQTLRTTNPLMIQNAPIMQNAAMVHNQVHPPMTPHQNHMMAGPIQPVNHMHQLEQFPMQQFPPQGPIMPQQQPPPTRQECPAVQFAPGAPGAPFPPINMTRPPPPLPPTFTPNHPPPTVSLATAPFGQTQNSAVDSRANTTLGPKCPETSPHKQTRTKFDNDEDVRRCQSASGVANHHDASLVCDYCSDATNRIKEVNKYIESLSQKESEEAFALETLLDIHTHFKDALFLKVGPELSWRIKQMINTSELSFGHNVTQVNTAQDAQSMLVQLFQAFIQTQIQQPEHSLSSLLSTHTLEHQAALSNQTLLAALGLSSPMRRSGSPPLGRANVQEEVSKLLEEHTSELNEIQAGLNTTAKANSSLGNSNLATSSPVYQSSKDSNHSSNESGPVRMNMTNGVNISRQGHAPGAAARAGRNNRSSPDTRANRAGVNAPSQETMGMHGVNSNVNSRANSTVPSAPPPAYNMNGPNSTVANNMPQGNIQPYYQMANQPPPRMYFPPEAQNPMQVNQQPQGFQNPAGPPPGFPVPGYPAPGYQQGFYPAFQQGFQHMPPSGPHSYYQQPPGFQNPGPGSVGPPNNANYQG